MYHKSKASRKAENDAVQHGQALGINNPSRRFLSEEGRSLSPWEAVDKLKGLL